MKLSHSLKHVHSTSPPMLIACRAFPFFNFSHAFLGRRLPQARFQELCSSRSAMNMLGTKPGFGQSMDCAVLCKTWIHTVRNNHGLPSQSADSTVQKRKVWIREQSVDWLAWTINLRVHYLAQSMDSFSFFLCSTKLHLKKLSHSSMTASVLSPHGLVVSQVSLFF